MLAGVYFYQVRLEKFYHHTIKSALEHYFGDLHIQMVVIKQKLQREDLCVVLQGKGREQKAFCILDTIVRRAHWVYGIPKIMHELLIAKLNGYVFSISTFWFIYF